MDIELSSEEYRDLLDIVHLADVVMSGHRREEDQRTVRHRALIQRLYSLTRTEGLSQFMTYNETKQAYVPTVDFERATISHPLLNEFGDHVFWDQLVSRLSVRDARLLAAGIGQHPLNEDQRRELEGQIRHRYVEEFSTNGLANVEVVQRVDMEPGLPVKTSD